MSAVLEYLPQAEPLALKPFLKRLSELLGLKPLKSERELARVVRERVSPEVVERLVQQGFSGKDVAFIIPPRTLTHRKARHERLTIEESDRAVRAVRILALAEAVFGEHGRALKWLSAPKKMFGGETALAMLASEAGARLVEEALVRMDEGYSA